MAVLRGTNKEHEMPGNPREIITMAERSFPVRIRIAVPPGGLGRRLTQMTAWLDENCGSNGWAMTASGMRRVLNDADGRSPAPFLHGGAWAPRPRWPVVCWRCAGMGRRRGSEWVCIGHREGRRAARGGLC